jgi:hypothetical protein
MAINRQIAVRRLIRPWEQVGPSVLSRARSLYINAEDEEEQELKVADVTVLPHARC